MWDVAVIARRLNCCGEALEIILGESLADGLKSRSR